MDIINNRFQILKYFILLAAAIFLAISLSACGSASRPEPVDEDSLQIVTTIFPEYDWVMNILGENPAKAKVTMLLDKGVDLHSYQPTADDILKISTCDLFIYVGGESDEWVEGVLAEAANKDMAVINLLDILGDSIKEEEAREGMQAEEEHEEETEYDEHVWLSLHNASLICQRIGEEVGKLDPSHASLYQKNLENYTKQLASLDKKYKKAIAKARVKTLLFGDRFPFRYFVDDYDLDYYAAFAGCSAETEASFETIAFLADKVDELGLRSILTIEGTNHSIAETIIKNTSSKKQSVLTLDSMQATSSDDVQKGASYLAIMKSNLAILKKALR